LFTLNENPLCHESPRRARKKFTRQGFSVAEGHHRPGAEVAFHQQFRNRKRRLLENASAASDGGSYNEMMLIWAAAQSVAWQKTIEAGNR
jgi:hypothetical protein